MSGEVADLLAELALAGLPVVPGHLHLDRGSWDGDEVETIEVSRLPVPSITGLTEAQHDRLSLFRDDQGRVWVLAGAWGGRYRIQLAPGPYDDADAALVSIVEAWAWDAETVEG